MLPVEHSVFSYDLPESAETTLSDAELAAREAMASVIERLYAEHGDEIEAAATEMKLCEYCKLYHYEEFILRGLVNRSLTTLSEDSGLGALIE